MRIKTGAVVNVGGKKYSGSLPEGTLPDDQVESLVESGILIADKLKTKPATKKKAEK